MPCEIAFAEHIVLEFNKCIISRFDVFANGLRQLFAKKLRMLLRSICDFYENSFVLQIIICVEFTFPLFVDRY